MANVNAPKGEWVVGSEILCNHCCIIRTQSSAMMLLEMWMHPVTYYGDKACSCCSHRIQVSTH